MPIVDQAKRINVRADAEPLLPLTRQSKQTRQDRTACIAQVLHSLEPFTPEEGALMLALKTKRWTQTILSLFPFAPAA